MSSFPHVNPEARRASGVDDRGVSPRVPAETAAETTAPIPRVPAETAAEVTTPIARVKDATSGLVEQRRTWRERLGVIIGTRPDPVLIAKGLVPERGRWLTWEWQTCQQYEARQARAAEDLALRARARKLAPVVESLKIAIAPMLGIQPIQVDVTVPLDFDADEEPGAVRLVVPPGWTGLKEAITGAITERLGGGDWASTWRMSEFPHTLTMRQKKSKPKPPKMVEWELSKDKYSIFVGRTGTKKIYVKTETETPHWGVSAGTGRGKTTTLLLPAIHWRGHGALVDVIDLKQDSYLESIAGISGFRIHTNVVAATMAMAEFLVSAKAIAFAKEQGYDMSKVPPRLLLMDEFGSFVSSVENWWKFGLGEKGSSPVFAWFHMILMQGRTKNHRVVLGTHDFAVSTFKGTGPRDLIGTKLLIGPVSNPKWVTTYGYDHKKIDYDSKLPGRGVIGVTGAAPEELQIAYITPEETRAVCSGFELAPEWFDNGEMAPWITRQAISYTDTEASVIPFLPPDAAPMVAFVGENLPGGKHVAGFRITPASQTGVLPPDQAEEAGTPLHVVLTPEQQAERRAAQLVGLREALEGDYLPEMVTEAAERNPDSNRDRWIDLALNILRKARKEQKSFPESKGRRGQELLYLVRDLQEWESSRPSKTRTDDTADDMPKAEGE